MTLLGEFKANLSESQADCMFLSVYIREFIFASFCLSACTYVLYVGTINVPVSKGLLRVTNKCLTIS